MRIIKPVKISAAALTSTIPEPDPSAGEVEWTAATYNQGDQRILSSTHKVYEVVAATTSDKPDVGAAKQVPTWIEIGATNKWRCFDQVVGSQSTSSSPLTIELDLNKIVSGLAVFNMNGVNSVRVTVTDPVDGLVYDNSILLRDESLVVDWFSYFFEGFNIKTEFVLVDLPAYKNAVIKLEFLGAADISVGEIVAGQILDLGVAVYGTSLQLLDFSRKERDDFGNFTIVRRRTSKLVDYDVRIMKGRINYVFGVLSGVTTTPCVWLGTAQLDDATLIYGYYKDTTINIDAPSYCTASITVEGLI